MAHSTAPSAGSSAPSAGSSEPFAGSSAPFAGSSGAILKGSTGSVVGSITFSDEGRARRQKVLYTLAVVVFIVGLVLGIVGLYFYYWRPTRTEEPSYPTGQPNIVLIIADDLGHADLGYSEGNQQTPTPNIDRLAWDGIILNRHYTHQSCSPTRSALMTGKYDFQTGLTYPYASGEPYGLPLHHKLLPQYLKDLNYSTFLLGKWHLGAHTREFYPDQRGFDYWLGYLEGEVDPFHYRTSWLGPDLGIQGAVKGGRNLYENGFQVAEDCTNNHYLPHLLTERFEQIIHTYNSSRPFFVYFSTPLPKANSEWNGTERVNRQFVMPQYAARAPVRAMDNKFAGRKQQIAQIQALDNQVGRITQALEDKGVLDNTIILFMSDNGGAPAIAPLFHRNHGSNWPLRMFRGTPFEGGVRNLAFIWSKWWLKRKAIATDQLFHVIDWLPTLYDAAGGKLSNLPEMSGVSQWTSLRNGEKKGPRTEIVASLVRGLGLLAEEPSTGTLYKLVGGSFFNNKSFMGWLRTEGTNATHTMTVKTSVSVNCGNPAGVERTACRPWIADCLFDLSRDPCETDNIAATNPGMLKTMQDKMRAYNATAGPHLMKPFDSASNPERWKNWWVPWMDPVPVKGPAPCLPFQPSSAI
ncbi:Arylsulfatase J [Hypsibius exemplaris]|uniref:Arylsulfatase J n=1 Tax=Hypsibius exemplaris TaxID=2072580 RepID=A0A9X6NPG3_HYPEX|nr:Arylsulfatase J [Hypsibius exemplaris]